MLLVDPVGRTSIYMVSNIANNSHGVIYTDADEKMFDSIGQYCVHIQYCTSTTNIEHIEYEAAEQGRPKELTSTYVWTLNWR